MGRAVRPRAVRRRDVAHERVDHPLLVAGTELAADDLLGQRDGGSGDLAAQIFFRLLDLLLDDELRLLADATGAFFGERDQPHLLGLRLLLDAGRDRSDLVLQRREPLLLLLEARFRGGADLGRRREVGLDLLVARQQRLADSRAAELHEQEDQHADTVKAIKARGEWIPGVIDPASRGRSQKDGTQLIEVYRELGLNLQPADNAREAGIHDVRQMMESGRLKVFKSLVNYLSEFRKYRRDEKGNVVKKGDHLQDCKRYAVRSGIDRMKTQPAKRDDGPPVPFSVDRYGGSDLSGRWMS